MADEDLPGGQRVLVVDDERDIRESLADIIETCIEGAKVTTAESGEEALERLDEISFDLIITDHRMGGMDGLQFLIEAQRVAPQVPRIMITAYPDIDLVVSAINEGHIINFLPKPFRGENVVEVVTEALQSRRQDIDRRKSLVSALRALQAQGV